MRFKNLINLSVRQLICNKQLNKYLSTSSAMANSKYEYVRKFEEANDVVLLPNCYIVVRVDGKNFHKFSKLHKFNKPNDKRCLDLLVKSAQHVMSEFAPWITLAYGQSDEFSFLFRKESVALKRRQNKITSLVASTFTSAFTFNWNNFFPSTRLLYPPAFDSRCVLYPDKETLIDYFRWRQVDCHINNLYNTTFHALTGDYRVVKLLENSSGDNNQGYEVTSLTAYEDPNLKILTPQEAEKKLCGTVSSDKNELLFSSYGVNYNNELEQFRKGTTIILTNGSDFDPKYLSKEEKKQKKLEASSTYNSKIDTTITTRDIINEQFWIDHRNLL